MTVLNQDSKDLMDLLVLSKKFSNTMFQHLANILEKDLDPIGLANYNDAFELIRKFDAERDAYYLAFMARKECEMKENAEELLRRCDEAIALKVE